MPQVTGAEFARRLRTARAYTDASQTDLATAIGVSPTTIGRIENGITEPSALQRAVIIQAVAQHLGVPTVFFEEGDLRMERAAGLVAALVDAELGLAALRAALAEVLPTDGEAAWALAAALSAAVAEDQPTADPLAEPAAGRAARRKPKRSPAAPARRSRAKRHRAS